MKRMNRWTSVLVGAGLVSLPALLSAEEKTSSVVSALTPTILSGYVDTSAQWNLETGNANVPNYSFGGPGKADGFNLNVVKVTLEHPLDEEGWAAGYKVDLFAGPDANTFASQSTGSAADFAIRQAYVALRAPVGNGLNFKVGVWDTLLGYEVTDAVANPNFTRSYGYTIEPVSHTGAAVSYQFADFLSASAAIANAYGPRINERAFYTKAESYKTYLGSITLTAPESMGFLAGSTLSGAVINGLNYFSPSEGYLPAVQTSWYLGAVLNTPVTGLKLGASYDYAGVDEQGLTGDEESYANATAIYASFQATEKLSLHARGEYASASSPATFMAEEVYAVTGTVQYDLWKNVVSRLEFRWDHAADGSKPYGGKEPGDGSREDSYILVANLVYKF